MNKKTTIINGSGVSLYEMSEPYKSGTINILNSNGSNYKVKEVPPDGTSENGYILISPAPAKGVDISIEYTPTKDTSPPLVKKDPIKDLVTDEGLIRVLQILKENMSSIDYLKKEMSKKANITDLEAAIYAIRKDLELLKEIRK